MSDGTLDRDAFVARYGGVYEHSPWIAERTFDRGAAPRRDRHADTGAYVAALARALSATLADASDEEKLGLIRAHPDLVGRAALAGSLTADSNAEQSSAGLDRCSPEELERFRSLNDAYRAKFGFPFVMAVRGVERAAVLALFENRLGHSPAHEFGRALDEIDRIARLRLAAIEATESVTAGEPPPSRERPTARTEAGMTRAQMRDPNFFPGVVRGTPLGIQHVLAMFVSNVTPAIIVAGAAGFGFGSADIGDMIYMIQMSMLFAGIATLIQTVSLGPVGAKLPVVQGTSFAFIPIMIPIAVQFGMAALMGGIVVGGLFHFFLGTIVGRIRHWLPPLVTGLVVLMIGLALVKVGIQYAAGGVPLIGEPEYGTFRHWGLALVVIAVTLGLKFFTRGMLSISAVLLGLLAGYVVALLTTDLVSFDNVGRAAWFAPPNPLHFGIEFNVAAIVGMCLMGIISAIETVGDISGITKGGAGREATDAEIRGGTLADGLGTAVSGVFGALPNTSFSQNVGLISMTGLMSRHVVTIGALFLIACGLVPKFGAAISSMPIAVLGGGVIVMFGMVAAAGVNMLADVAWNRRNMMIFAVALSIGLGLQLEPGALQHLPPTLSVLMTSGLLPAALIAIVLNLVIPQEDDEELGSEPETDATTPAAVMAAGDDEGDPNAVPATR